MKLIPKGVKSLAVALLLSNFSLTDTFNKVRADQPVHCLREEFFGEWIFTVTQDKQTLNLFETDQICTHVVPNKIQLVNKAHDFKFENSDTYKVNILDNFKAEAVFCKNGKACESKLIKGHWTMIYDQGFSLEFEDGQRFIANFRYNLKPAIAQDPFTEAKKNGIYKFAAFESGDYDKFDSKCDETMVGFVQQVAAVTGKQNTMTQHQAQCFHAARAQKYNYEETKEVITPKMKENVIIAKHKVTPLNLLEGDVNKQSASQASEPSFKKTRARKRVNMHLEHKPSDEMDLMISAINSMDLGWKADTCKYQKHHENYGEHCEGEALNLVQTSSSSDKSIADDMEGLFEELSEAENKPQFGDLNNPEFVKALESAQNFQKGYKNAMEIPDKELPESFDLRNINGYDFTSEFRDQGHCGSCYTVSFIQVAEARLKMKYGKQPPLLSPQFMMSCNYMNEGCDGGWPHFNVFLAEQGHLVSEECAPYKGQTKGDSCGNYSKCEPIAKVNQSYFLGGAWGSTTEKKMMKEVLRNGAINGDFQAPSMFSVYKEGIFSEKGMVHLHNTQKNTLLEMIGLAQTGSSQENEIPNDISDKSLNDKGKVAWMDMNHSVVILGWGKDKKTNTKYWIVRNSYGPHWGMDGDFLVKRGENDFGMEVEQIAFHPVLCGEDGSVCQ